MTNLKNSVMIILTAVFIILYAAALLGWLKPLSDVALVMRLEPIIFIIIGYFFGRLPAQQNEENLKSEISRQIKKADAAQNSREQTQCEREALEEKLKNARTILTAAGKEDLSVRRGERSGGAANENDSAILRHSLKTAVSVLDS